MSFNNTFALAVLTSSLLLGACGKSGQQQDTQHAAPADVGVVVAQAQTLPLQREFVGRLTPFRSAQVRARVAGIVQKRVYVEGSHVDQNQILFEIDPAPLQAALNAALASLAQSQATSANNHVAAQRARELAPKGFVSTADRDNADAAERSAAAAVKQAQANVDTARINLGYATVRAPIAGRSGKQAVTEGALVGQGDATLLTTVEQIDPIYVDFTMSVADLTSMRIAMTAGRVTLAGTDQIKVQLTLPGGEVYAPTGLVDFSGAMVDPATGTVRSRAQLTNPDRVLLPGMFVTLTAILGQQRSVFSIPQAALQRDAGGSYVLVVGPDDKVVRKSVTTASAQDGQWIISEGLVEGDRIIVSGIQRARPGEPAKASPWTADVPALPGSPQPAAGSAPPRN